MTDPRKAMDGGGVDQMVGWIMSRHSSRLRPSVQSRLRAELAHAGPKAATIKRELGL